jgi:hypothetical protein
MGKIKRNSTLRKQLRAGMIEIGERVRRGQLRRMRKRG